MFCSRCGKKVLEYMRFCPFCGMELVVPEQDAEAGVDDGARAETDAATSEPVKFERFTFDIPSDNSEDESDVSESSAPEPLPRFEAKRDSDREFSWSREREDGEMDSFLDDDDGDEEDETYDSPGDEGRFEADKLSHRGERAFDRSGSERRRSSGRRQADTYVPAKPLKDEDIFMDEVADADGDEDDYDEYDRYEHAHMSQHRHHHRHYEEDDDDDDDRSFFMRHIRGFIGVILFAALILLLVFYFLSDAGQLTLARVNATLPVVKAETYARVGRDYYKSGDYQRAGIYYERALARDPSSFPARDPKAYDSYDWASSAATAYITGGYTDKAAEMLKKCIEINPEATEAYYNLLNLYPNANSRPPEVSRLLQQGYERTGDARLRSE